MPIEIPDIVKGAIDVDPWLEPFANELASRRYNCLNWLKTFDENENGLLEFASSYKKYGLQPNPKDFSITYKEWAPNAVRASLIGDFNNWDENSNVMQKDDYGSFNIILHPSSQNPGQYLIPHDSEIKIRLWLPNGEVVDRLPAWITRATAPNIDLSTVVDKSLIDSTYKARFWNPESPYTFKHQRPKLESNDGLRIYECHVGISTPNPVVGSYKEFTKNLLPKIKDLGYNAIQLMAIMEHAYYASFGYQITNFFAISSRFGTPEDLKELIDTAHSLGIVVLLDIVHSHTSKNVLDGL